MIKLGAIASVKLKENEELITQAEKKFDFIKPGMTVEVYEVTRTGSRVQKGIGRIDGIFRVVGKYKHFFNIRSKSGYLISVSLAMMSCNQVIVKIKGGII